MENTLESTKSGEARVTITPWEVIFIEALSVFLIVSVTMFTTIWYDIVRTNYSQFTSGLFIDIVTTALTRTVVFILGYSIAKSLYSFIRRGIGKSALFLEEINKKQVFVIHIFAIVALIIAFSPIRPVIQRPIFSADFSTIQDVAVGFTNYDFLHTIGIIGPLTLISIALLFLFNTAMSKKGLRFLSAVFIVFAMLCSLYNFQPKFQAKILEARGYVNIQQEVLDYSGSSSSEEAFSQSQVGKKVLQIATEALDLAKNDTERALALRWIANGHGLQLESEKALEFINESIRLDPQDYAYGELSYTFIDLRKYQSAIAAANTCIGMNQEASFCYAPLAKAQWFMGDYEKSQETIKKALAIMPNSKLLHELSSYYETAVPIELSFYTTEQREARKDNEPLNACLAVAVNEYHRMAEIYCKEEGKPASCTGISSFENAEKLSAKFWEIKQGCFEKFPK